ncbi:MAG: response regulator [Actinomycetota bacterium]
MEGPGWLPAVVIADANEASRAALARLAEIHLGWRVVGSVADGIEALAEVRRLRPEFLVVDEDLEGLGGFEIARLLMGNPHTSVVTLVKDPRSAASSGCEVVAKSAWPHARRPGVRS